MVSAAHEERFSSYDTQTRTLSTMNVSLPWLGTQEDTQKIARIRHACSSNIILNQSENIGMHNREALPSDDLLALKHTDLIEFYCFTTVVSTTTRKFR